MTNAELKTVAVDEIEGNFFVPDYQRGYRWEKNEVVQLLNDVYNLKAESGQVSKDYCLQPIVVKKLGEKFFEVIDGQQRLTTLFLIYNYMYEVGGNFLGAPKFSLSYKTREKSADFLANIKNNLNRREENIDFWFMASAYDEIKKWFDNKNEPAVAMLNIKKLLAENVQVIWYEVEETEDAVKLFTRLNIGKIPLTNAELVKAMFLSRSNKKNIEKATQDEIALQWDNIEKDLHRNSLWYFLTGKSSERYQTRIDIVLDLISEKKANERDEYFTFFYFNKLRETEDLNKIWQEKIVQTFLLLKDWREHRDFYHKIGYLISSGAKSLSAIYKESKGKTKSKFLEKLDDFIKDSISLKKDEKYSDWDYETHGKRIFNLLLLFNVESVRQIEENSQWFPFDKFKSDEKGKNSWSLEHVHAVKSKKGDKDIWREWLKLHKESLELLPEDNFDLISEIDNLLEKKDIPSVKFEPLQEKIIKKFSLDDDVEKYVNSIANLALLKCETNSALGNSTFDVKRNEIIKMDMEGKFIPFCTKMLFLKYYTRSEKNQIHFWSQADRDAYISAINKILENFLAEPINFVGEEV